VAKDEQDVVPRRTREHVIASQSHNYVEKFIIDKGHTVERPTDYGVDIFMKTFDEEGYAENGDISLQLKASDNLSYSKDGSFIAFEIEVKHYQYWKEQPMPVFLILYDAGAKRAYWLYVQEYLSAGSGKRPHKKAKSMTFRVPVKNELTAGTIDYMRERKTAIMQQMRGHIRHEE
jgi:Domain of unknown function (DUF4365)